MTPHPNPTGAGTHPTPAAPPPGASPSPGRLRVVIVSQEDLFTIPRNVARVLALPGIEVPAVFVVDTSGSVLNRKGIFFRGFGPLQSARMGLQLASARALDLLDRLLGARWLQAKRSLAAAARQAGVEYGVVTGVNDADFVARIAALAPDVVLSFSAPCVFKTELLRVPRLGCVNLHCSLLPRYAGLLPSFWVLYHAEAHTGATLHFMDDRIDNGAILAQTQVPIDPGMSMFQLVERTKAAGGDLVCQTLLRMRDGVPLPVQPNRAEEGSYFKWPTVEQMRDFRRRGGRLI